MVGAQSISDLTIVFVQGSFQTPLVYDKLIEGLKPHYPTLHPELPSCSNIDQPEFPTVDLSDDCTVVKGLVEDLVQNQGKLVVVLMHSYGGLVGSNAITQELSFVHRQSKGLAGGVIHLFYFTAFLLDERQAVFGVFGESPNNDVKVQHPILSDISLSCLC